jgi:hypothetical protein
MKRSLDAAHPQVFGQSCAMFVVCFVVNKSPDSILRLDGRALATSSQAGSCGKLDAPVLGVGQGIPPSP